MSGQLQEQVLDRGTALARVGGDVDLLREIAALFLEEYPRELEAMHQALTTGDSKMLEHAAHGLKGSVANFYAQSAVDAAFQLEQLGRAQKLDQAAPALATLERTLETLHAELAAL